MKKSKLLLFSLAFCVFSFAFKCYAKDVTILYTGETHAMLYPCNCPIEPDGGVSRRATLIKELRKKNPYTLVLDSGGFFAGGLMDEYTQNTELDMQRSLINLKAMEIMRYDAAAVGDDEFNFGKDFFSKSIANSRIAFLGANMDYDGMSHYVIKEVSGVKVGLTSVTTLLANTKIGGAKLSEPKPALEKTIRELKAKGAHIIVVLGHLDEQDSFDIIRGIEGIDVFIMGHNSSKSEPSVKVGSTLILRPAWQGKSLGKVVLQIKDNKIANYKVENIRLADKISDSPEIKAILPRCFSDNNCRKGYVGGTCTNPGVMQASCVWPENLKALLTIVTPKDCTVCNTEDPINFLRRYFPGLEVRYLKYPEARSVKIINDLGLKTLPVYLLNKEIEKDKGFDTFKDNVELKGDYYMLKPGVSGLSYFIGRKKTPGMLDFFFSLYDKNADKLLTAVKSFKPQVHFLVTEQMGNFDAAKGNLEVEECLRAVCVKKHYPQIFWDYISCRAKHVNSSWWEDCLNRFDATKIMNCAKSDEAKILLRENISLNKELQVMFGPTYLMDNQQIFSSEGVVPEEELKKIIKR